MTSYQKEKKGRLDRSFRLSEIGRILIALRIYRKLSQKNLADKLGLPESEVTRNERNGYADFPVDQIPKVLSALGARCVRVEIVRAESQA